MSTVKVRDATPEDTEDIFRLLSELAVLENFGDSYSVDVENFKRNGFGEGKQFHCLLAEDIETKESQKATPAVIGLLLYTWLYNTWAEGRIMHIEDLIVTQTRRKQGVGTSLVQHAVEIADENNFKRIQLMVRKENAAVVEFYKRIGFTNHTDTRGWNVLRMAHQMIKDRSSKSSK